MGAWGGNARPADWRAGPANRVARRGDHPSARSKAVDDGSRPPQVQRLIELAIAERQRGEHMSALDRLKAVRALGTKDIGLQIEIAVTHLAFDPPSETHLSEAAACCDAVLDKAPHHARARFLLGLIARRRGDHAASLLHLKKAADLNRDNLDYRLEVVRTQCTLGRFEQAKKNCHKLLKEKPDNVRVLTMLGTIAHESKDYSSAIGHFELAAQKAPQNPDVQEKLAKSLREMARYDEAAGVYRKVLAQHPARNAAIMGLLSILRKQKHSAAATQEAIAIAASAPDNIRARLEVARLLLARDHLDEASSAFRGILEDEADNIPAVLGLATVARTAAEYDEALAHLARAAALKPHDPKIEFDIAHVLYELLRREEADEVVRRCDEDPLMNGSTEYQTAKLRYFCRTLQFDRAKEATSCWPTHRDIPDDAVGLVACLYAVRGEWEQIFELVHERGANGSRLCSPSACDMLTEAVARAARHTGKYEEVLTLTERWPDHTTRLAAADLRDQTLEEMLLLNAIGLVPGVSQESKSASQLPPLRSERHARCAAVLSAAPGPADSNATGERTIYYCTDTQYLLGAAVSLFSLLRNNRVRARAWDFKVYCASEAFGFGSQIFGRVAAHFGIPIDVRDTAGLLPSSLGFRTIRGFRGLFKLSEAAYFRIYAAIQLLREKGGHALYIDCDTCVGPDLDTLVNFDLGGMPLAAWHESLTQPGARRPTKRLGLKPGTYFNSGVLLFDLGHPELEASLFRALDVAQNQQDVQIFLDQDCLNAAFKELTVSLPKVCNFFVREDDEVDSSVRPVVTHFTGHPKPWDPWYSSANCVPWVDEFVGLGEVLGPEMTGELLRSNFQQAWNGRSSKASAAAE